MKHLWEADHDYYCEGQNYFASGVTDPTVFFHQTWAEFMDEFSDADDSYNLVFRWDWHEGSDWEDGISAFNGDRYYRNGQLRVCFMHQRKGFHTQHRIMVCRADEPEVRKYLFQKWKHLSQLWAPLSGEES